MKILAYGTYKPKIITCKECGATLEYTPNDIKKHTNKFHSYHYVECPVCGNWCFVTVGE